MAKSKGKRQPIGLGRWILIMICLIVFCGSGAKLLFYALDKINAENDFKQLRESVLDLSTVYDQNSDFIGWITVPDTKIDYPVMQTPDDPEYYLYRNFSKEYSASGTPFLDGASVVLAEDPEDITWNWLIYGHHMKFGTMFHDLLVYADKEFWEDHKTFTFAVYDPETRKTDKGEYEVFAASKSKIRATDSDAFKYYEYAGYTTEDEFNEYVAGVKSESSYDTGITPEFGDQLVTLSTCAYHTKEGRFYIVGRRVK